MTRLRKPIPRKPSKKIRDLSQKEINEIAVGPREYLSLYFDCEKFRLKDYESDLRNYEFLKLLTVDERQAMEDLPDQRFEPWHPDYDPERKRDDPDLLRELGLPMTLYHLARVQTFAGESPVNGCLIGLCFLPMMAATTENEKKSNESADLI